MKPCTRPLLVLLSGVLGLGLLLSACGQKGPLYLPEPEPERERQAEESRSR
jgi:predicted small lipoprotein YifL